MKKMLINVDDKVLLKMATEKAWNEFKDKVESEKKLKQLLKSVLQKEKVFFTYTWRINDCRTYGTMYGDNFKDYADVLKILNYTQNYESYDSKWTKEVDAGFIFDDDYWLGKVSLVNYIFGTVIEKEYGVEFIYIKNKISDKIKKFLGKFGYSLYKKYVKYGNDKEKRFYIVA